MNKTVRSFRRIPSDAGVTFEGFEHVSIQSREVVRRQLEEFVRIAKASTKPTIRVLIGEWGEGKTDAFNRYLRPTLARQGDLAFYVSASTLSNSLSLPDIVSINSKTSLSAVRFLLALFHSIREESKVSDIPSVSRYSDAYSYLGSVFHELIGDDINRKIFVFIDEFEELLTNKQALKEIISGIKETINGRYSELDENGRFAGSLHFVIAATPDSFYQLQVADETALVFGGLGRRIGVIELNPVRKEEAIRFLIELIKFCYDNSIPSELPIASTGILHTIHRVTQGNPGNMVSLFARIMNSAKIDEDKMKCTDFEHLLGFLGHEVIFVYGGTTDCLNNEFFNKMLTVLSEQKDRRLAEICCSVIKLIVGELKPFSVEELESRTGAINVPSVINTINQKLESEGLISRAVLRVSPLKAGKSFKEVEEAFKSFIVQERDVRVIKIDNYVEKVEELRDRITWFHWEDSSVLSRIFLPSDQSSVYSFFEGITTDRAKELANLITRRLCDQEVCYLASEQILEQVYPSPAPRELEFIKDRQERMKIWRDTTRRLAEYFDQFIPEAFIWVNELAGVIQKEQLVLYSKLMSYYSIRFRDYKINTLFFAVNGDFDATDVENLHRRLKTLKPSVHCAIVIYTGEKTPEAEQKILDKGLGKEGENLLVELRVHPTLAKRLISIYRAAEDPEQINQDLLIATIKRISVQDIGLEGKLNEWLIVHKEKGKLIEDLRPKYTSDLRLFADTLRFFINTVDTAYSLDEIFKINKRIAELTKFGGKISLLRDIEFPQFSRIAEDLASYGFIEKEGDKCRVRSHRVEEEIKRKLFELKTITESELSEYFVTRNPRFLSDVFIPILEYKGMISRNGGRLDLVNLQDLREQVREIYESFKRIVAMEECMDWGYVFMAKERGTRFIAIQDFLDFVKELYEKSEILQGEQASQKLTLTNRLINYFSTEFLPLFKKAKEDADQIIRESEEKLRGLKVSLDEVQEQTYRWAKIEVKKFVEFEKAQNIFEQLDQVRKYDKEHVAQVVESLKENEDALREFSFNRDEASPPYFNPKLYTLRSLANELNKIVSDTQEPISMLREIFQDLQEEKERLVKKLRSMDIVGELKISAKARSLVERRCEDILSDVQPVEKEFDSLDEAKKSVASVKDDVGREFDVLDQAISSLEDLAKCEEDFCKTLSGADALVGHAIEIFDSNEYRSEADKFLGRVNNVHREYEEIPDIASTNLSQIRQDIRKVSEKISTLNINAKEIAEDIETFWKNYAKQQRTRLDSIDYIIQGLCKSYPINASGLVKEIDELKGNLTASKFLDVKLRISDIEKKMKEVRENFYGSVKPVLSAREASVLEILISQSRMRDRPWMDLSEFCSLCEGMLKIPRSEADNVINRLMELGLVKQGISVSI